MKYKYYNENKYGFEWYAEKLEVCLFDDLDLLARKLGNEIIVMRDRYMVREEDENEFTNYYYTNVIVRHNNIDNETINYNPILTGYGLSLRKIAD